MGAKVWSAVLLVAAACGDPAEPEPEPTPEPRPAALVFTGDAQADTVTAQLVQALVAEVLDTLGAPLEGETIRFTAVPADSLFYNPSVTVAPLDSEYYSDFAADSTGPDGRAGVVVRLGIRAGPGGVIVTVPRLGLVDTAEFTIRPGAATRVLGAPGDTAAYVGATFPLRVQVMDRFANRRNDVPTFAALDPFTTVTPAGVVEAKGVGRGKVEVRFGPLRDTSWVSVVPVATFAASGSGVVVIAGLDGSARQQFTVSGGYNGHYPSWTAAPGALAIVSGTTLHVLEPSGLLRPLLTGPDSGLTDVGWPIVARGAAQVFFTGVQGGYSIHVWRLGLDGTGLELLSPNDGDADSYPAPSPDGSRMAFVTTRGTGYFQLAVMDLATRETTTFGIAALSLRWAPQSNRIAYLSDADRSVWVINADGTGARKVSTSGRSHQIGIDWSPDEQWLLVTTYESGIELINVATGATLPIPFARGLTEPVWKP